MSPLTRKRFLGSLLAMAGAGMAGSAVTPPARARVAVARLKRPRDVRAEPEVVRRLLAAGLEAYGHGPPTDLLAGLLGDAQAIGVKVNCVSRHISTSPALCDALVELLGEAGIAPDRVVVYDRSNQELSAHGRYALSRGPGRQCFGCQEVGYVRQTGMDTEFSMSRLLTDTCDALIGLPILKEHAMTGITAALKNCYGCLEHPSLYHGVLLDCCPYLAHLWQTPALRERHRLIITDALVGLCDGGPYGPGVQWPAATVLVSRDPVAADVVGWELLNAARAARDLSPIPFPAHLAEAGAHGIGVSDPAAIERVDAPV